MEMMVHLETKLMGGIFKMFILLKKLFCVIGSFACMDACASHVHSTHRGQKTLSDALDLEF